MVGDIIHTMKSTEPWPARNFSKEELRCKGSGTLYMPESSVVKLQRARDLFDGPLTIVSGYRSPKHNQLVGGAPKSFHLSGKAFDVETVDFDAGSVAFLHDCLIEAGFTGIGVYRLFIHADLGPRRMWHGA